MRTNRGGDREPKTCDWTIERFSADGAHFAGYPSGVDGLGSATVALLDAATAKPVVTFERQGDGVTFVADVAWEDETHALATLHEDGPVVPRPARPRRARWSGSTRRPGPPEESPFHFAARLAGRRRSGAGRR